MKRLLSILFLLPLFALAQPQTSYDTTFTGSSGSAWNAMVNLPDNYYTTGALDSFALFIWFPGNGENGSNVNLLDDAGFHYWIRTQGWNGEITLGNGTHKVIYISLQLPYDWQNPVTSAVANSLLKPKLDAILARYRVKANSTVAFGISAGAGTMGWYHTYKPTALDDTYAMYFKASVHIVERAHTTTEGAMLAYPQRWGHTAVLGHRALSFAQTGDGTEYGRTWTDNMRDSVANSATFFRTSIDGGGHRGWNTIMDPNERNWTISHADVELVEGPDLGTQNVYEWALRQCDTNFVTGGSPLAASAGPDFFKVYDQDNNTPSFTIAGSASAGTPTSWNWTQLTGPNTSTLTNANTQTVTVSNITKGHYSFELTIGDGVNADVDTVNVWIRDYNEAGSWPCRPGGGQTFHLGNEIVSGIVSTTFINAPYINRQPYVFGEQVMGGDTIKLYRNPNNSGIWNTIVTGYVGGSNGCPVYIIPADTNQVEYRDYWRMAAAATGDTNFVQNVVVDGTAWRDGNEHVYGFKLNSPTFTGLAMVAHNFRKLTVKGFRAVGGPFFMKKDSDSTKLFSIYNNFNPGPPKFYDIYVSDTDGEAFYIGTTDVDGGSFDGPTHKGADSAEFNRIIVARNGWDAIQVSNYGNNVVIKNTVVYKSGTANQSSQQAGQFGGGYTQTTIDSSVLWNGTGGMSLLGKGRSWIKNSIIDSVQSGSTTTDAVYNSSAVVSVPPPLPDSLEAHVEGNIINRIERRGVFHANTSSRMKKGAIRNNVLVDPSKNLSQLIVTNASDTVENNTLRTAINYDTSVLAQSLPAWAVFNLIRYDSVTNYSFYDVTSGNVNPVADAGSDITITLPTSATTLSGSGSDADGTISTYAWTRESGPNTPTIVSSSSASTNVTGLIQGTYVFRLTVTDNDGATHYDEATVTVNAAPRPYSSTIHLKRVN